MAVLPEEYIAGGPVAHVQIADEPDFLVRGDAFDGDRSLKAAHSGLPGVKGERPKYRTLAAPCHRDLHFRWNRGIARTKRREGASPVSG